MAFDFACSLTMALLIALILLVAAIASYAASLACRFMRERRRKIGWHCTALGVLAVDALWSAWLLVVFLFRSREWNAYPYADPAYIPTAFLVISVIGYLGASPTVLFFRERYKN